MNVLEWQLNVNFFFFSGAIWWTVLREGLGFTLNLFMHVVIGGMKERAEEEDIYAECLSLCLSQAMMVRDGVTAVHFRKVFMTLCR